MIYESQNCQDFSTSTGLSLSGINTRDAWMASDKLGLSGGDARKFTQGFIHARQSRVDIITTIDVNQIYADGYAAAGYSK